MIVSSLFPSRNSISSKSIYVVLFYSPGW
jgi:hypothetical protein